MTTSNVLIICRSYGLTGQLEKIKPQAQVRYILASDDPRVHELAKRFLWIDKVCWIEQMESFLNVAQNVISFTETINGWLKNLADEKRGFPEELFIFTRAPEGGMTTQRIQDALLLIRSYFFLFDTYKIDTVLIISRPGMGWEDDVLREASLARKIDVKVIRRYSFLALIKNMQESLKLYARVAYYAVNIFRIGVGSRFKHRKIKATDKEIVFQLCSSSYKHVDNIIPLMKALKLKNYRPVALCWHSHERYTRQSGADRVRAEGLDAEELEGWCSFFDAWGCIVGVLYIWNKIKLIKNEFLSHQALNYRSVPLGNILWPSIRFFIFADLPLSCMLYKALKKYFKDRLPIAIKLWGGITLKEGYLAQKSLDRKEMPLIFFYSIGVIYNGPYYDDVDTLIDLLFVAGEIQKKITIKANNIPPENIEICGQSRYEGLHDFRKSNDHVQSLLCLGIQGDFVMRILFDSQYIIRGLISVEEQAIALNALLRFAARYPSVALLVKPHPCHHKGLVEELIGHRSGLKNVFLIDKNMLPYHALNVADVLITKFSTLGIEAMMFNCPVVSCILDGEKRFEIYENAADYVYGIESLEQLLNRLMMDNDFRQSWREDHLQKQKIFLSEYFCEMEMAPSLYQAEILDKRLKERACNAC